MFWAIMCPSSGADDCVMLSPRVGVVPWLQEGCQDRLAGSVSIEDFVTQQLLNVCLHPTEDLLGIAFPIYLHPILQSSGSQT